MGANEGRRGMSPGLITAIVLYAALLAATAVFGFLLPVYIAMIFAFLHLMGHLWRGRSRLAIDLPRLMVLVFVLAIATRFIMLHHDDVITRDMTSYVERSEDGLDGKVPYRDFNVNKPPAYLYLGMGIASTLGPSVQVFRAVFSVLDALVAVTVLLLGWRFRRPEIGAWAGIAYAISPFSAVMIGYSGHYDPAVVLATTLGIYCYMRGRLPPAFFLLGIAFSLKYYTIFLLPLLLLDRNWRDRTAYLMLFAAPMVVSWIPLTLYDRGLPMSHTLGYQGGQWVAEVKKSFAFAVVEVGGMGPLAIGLSYLVTFIMLGVLFSFIVTSLVGRKHNDDPVTRFVLWKGRIVRGLLGIDDDNLYVKWFRAIVVIFILYYGAVTIGGIHLHLDHVPMAWPGLAIAFAAVYFPATFLAYRRLRDRLTEFDMDPSERFLTDVTFTLILLLLALPNLTPWYILWVLPTLLLVSDLTRHLLLVLIPWNFPGKGL